MLESLQIAISMYSRIPVPGGRWSEKGMRYALCFFPLVGVVIGAVMSLFFSLCLWLELPELFRCCLGTVIPILISGGIHMDGLLDTLDARSSCQSRERKLEILKDPHTGAFAIIGSGVYLLSYAGVFSLLPERAFPAATGIYVFERALSGLSVVSFPRAKKEGLASTFAEGGDRRTERAVLILWATAAAVFWAWTGGAAMAALLMAAGLGVFGWYYCMAKKEFGGVTGDLAGYFLQIAELVLLAVLAWGLRFVGGSI